MKQICPVCDGTGMVPGDFGIGKINPKLTEKERKKLPEKTCPACGGTGMQEGDCAKKNDIIIDWVPPYKKKVNPFDDGFPKPPRPFDFPKNPYKQDFPSPIDTFHPPGYTRRRKFYGDLIWRVPLMHEQKFWC